MHKRTNKQATQQTRTVPLATILFLDCFLEIGPQKFCFKNGPNFLKRTTFLLQRAHLRNKQKISF